MSTQIKIIDPHIHLWDPYTTPKLISPLVKMFGKFPWLLDKVTRLVMPKSTIDFVGKSEYVVGKHLPETFHGDTGKYKVDGYVHIQAGWEGKGPLHIVGETEWLMTLDDKPLAIVGQAHLNDLDNLDDVLDAHAATSPQFKGVRDMIARHDLKSIMDFNMHGEVLQSADFMNGYARLGERNLTYDAFLYSHQLQDFIKLVKEVPQTKVVLDHIGTPIGVGGPYNEFGLSEVDRDKIISKWYEDLAALSDVGHVHMKLSGLLMPILGYQFEKWETLPSVAQVVDAIGPHVEFAIKTFGIDKCMFASNFPMDKVSVTYETLYDAYFQIADSQSPEDQQMLFSQNALRFYGIDAK